MPKHLAMAEGMLAPTRPAPRRGVSETYPFRHIEAGNAQAASQGVKPILS